MEYSDEYLRLIARVKRSQVQMLRDRGYLLPAEEAALYLTAPTLDEAIASLASLTVAERDELLSAQYLPAPGPHPPEPLWVFYSTEVGNFNIDALAALHAVVERDGLTIQGVMLVCHQRPTPTVRKALTDQQVDIWSFDQLALNVMSHFLQQQFVALTTEERLEFFKATRLDPTQLPWMYETDAVVRWYGFRVGQIIRIRRANLLAGANTSGVFYRLVIPKPALDEPRQEWELP